MTCTLCKSGETSEGYITVTLTRNNSVIVIRDVPAEVCNNCGEYYLSDSIAEKIYDLADQAVKKGVEIEILRWVA
ncbi:MAG TPA: type II toxin-antitoxin system MqsA family antitoxin [Spirochaetota bacterium]|nr:type II toxin-antitoxin system MqsA family antitoxin [Spirochaetota bacterium]